MQVSQAEETISEYEQRLAQTEGKLQDVEQEVIRRHFGLLLTLLEIQAIRNDGQQRRVSFCTSWGLIFFRMSALRHELEQVVFHVNVCTQPWQAQLRTKQMETQITTSRQEKEPFTFKNMKDVVSLNNFEAGDLMLFFEQK